MKLFCIPYSGGTANIYWDWKKIFNNDTEVCPVEYMGHGRLFGRGFYQTLHQAAEDILNRYLINNNEPYIIYGHSLGSLVAFEIGNILMKSNIKKPEHIIFAAMRPPHLLYKRTKYTGMPKEAFMKRIFDLGNTSEEVLCNDELKELAFEILSADMMLVDNYQPVEFPKFDFPVSVFAGKYDNEIPEEDAEEWKNYAGSDFNVFFFNGDHFFPFKNDTQKQTYSKIKEIINNARITQKS